MSESPDGWSKFRLALKASQTRDRRPKTLREIAKKRELWHHEPYHKFFFEYVSMWKPAVVLEIGVRMGTNTLHLARACRETLVIGVEIEPERIPRQVTRKKNVEIVGMNSADALDDVLRILDGRGVDVCFFDASHKYEESSLEWKLYGPLVVPGGLQVFDDITNEALIKSIKRKKHVKIYKRVVLDMRKFWSEIPPPKEIHRGLHPGKGIGVRVA